MMWEAFAPRGALREPRPSPATPANMTLLRCSLCAEHSSEQVDQIPRHVRSGGTSYRLHRLIVRHYRLAMGRVRLTS